MDQTQISSPVTKVVVAWGGVVVSFTMDWPQFAGMLASLYTALMIGEWLWKHGVRSFCEKRGWVKPTKSKPSQGD
jgi:hypothetical protein